MKALRASQVPEVQPVENSDASAPKRMKLQQRYLEKVGFTPSCIKCRSLQCGDKTVTTGHSPECRIRVEAEMMKHEDLRDEPEKANNRINEYIAKKIEENWTEKVRIAHEAPRRIMNKCRQWILTAMKLHQEKDHQVLWETHMMLVILLVLKWQERMILRIWMNLLRSKDWLKLMVQSAKENKRSLTKKVQRGLG